MNHLQTYPVQALILGPHQPDDNQQWLNRVGKTPIDLRPRWVVEFWYGNQLLYEDGPMSKSTVSRWQKEGYYSSCQLVPNLAVGGVVDAEWLVVTRSYEGGLSKVVRDVLRRGFAWPDVGEAVVRPMENCLRHHGVPRQAYQNTGHQSDLPDSKSDPMPQRAGTLISTPRGVRRLLNDELAKGLGVPNAWLRGRYPSGRLLKQTIPLHTLEYVSTVLIGMQKLYNHQPIEEEDQPCTAPEEPGAQLDGMASDSSLPTQSSAPPTGIDWKPPDLGPRSSWTRRRVLNLIDSCLLYDDPAPMIEDGLMRLRKHRKNYDSEGPKPQELQVLWWEFPREEWDSLREGSTMHFLREPRHEHTPNAVMTESQICIAEEFVEELVSLGVLLPVSKHEMVANGPLFTLPKPGQPGQWRIISDMRRGGQNEASAADPTVFPKPGTILEQMYPGGWTAVVDASKFFYQFPTYPPERKFLGCIHPRDPNRCYVYAGLPMGATASPAHAGRYGTALLRKLRMTSPLFQGTWRLNTWYSQFSKIGAFDPTLGHGMVLMGSDNQPACLVWAHCDDFMIHGPSLEKTLAAVRAFMDLTVDVGMLCNPAKITPPGQAVRYTGLIFDTETQPTLRIPPPKLSRAKALVDYALSHRSRLSRLSLAVIVGTLESLTPATPDYIGRTYLRHLQTDLHPPDWEGEELPYYSFTVLSANAQAELSFWLWLLKVNPGRAARGSRSGTLVPSFGDGSGTGTGGTVCYPDDSAFEMWMGTWAPRVYHFSSNWKELQTLLATLERASKRPDRVRLRGATFFYFTDNLVTYYVVSNGTSTAPGLHSLVIQVKRLSISLGIHLEVVHVPGTLLIAEGTDGLSRGIWNSPLHGRPTHATILSRIFAPASISPAVAQWARATALLPPSIPVELRHWADTWDPRLVFDQLTFWAPPPEVAAQLISHLLQCYVERPYTTCCLILIPRVLQRRWGRMSRHVLELGVFSPLMIPHVYRSAWSIPLVLLYLPYHTLSLDSPRMDSPAPTALQRLHRTQAAFVRGL